MSELTLPQKILRAACSKAVLKGLTLVQFYKLAGLSSKQFYSHWRGDTDFMRKDTRNNITNAVINLKGLNK